MNIEIVSGYDRTDDVVPMLEEYTQLLLDGDPLFKEYLDLQRFDDEIEDISVKYGEPRGRFLVAYIDGEAAGCVALRELDEENCEMKRLYVRPKFRGVRLGSLLVDRIIDEARAIGYDAILLDTLPFLKTAIKMYERRGFYFIDSYNNSPMDTSIFMKMDL